MQGFGAATMFNLKHLVLFFSVLLSGVFAFDSGRKYYFICNLFIN